jgi:hypothetical protein
MKQIATVVALVTAVSAHADTVVIERDNGGNVRQYQDMVSDWRARRTSVEVVGICASACTMVLSLRDVCTTTDAAWGFHGASGRGEYAFIAEALGNNTLANSYPSVIRSEFWRKWSQVKGDEAYWISGAELIRVGAIRECDK